MSRKDRVRRSSLSAREYLTDKKINLIEQVLARIPKLDLKDQVESLIKLFPYVYPKLQTITVETKTPEQIELESMSTNELYEKVKTIVMEREQWTKVDSAIEEVANAADLSPTLNFRPTQDTVRGSVPETGGDNAPEGKTQRTRTVSKTENQND